MALRKTGTILRLEDLKKLGVVVARVSQFVTLKGKVFTLAQRPRIKKQLEKQLFFWEEI